MPNNHSSDYTSQLEMMPEDEELYTRSLRFEIGDAPTIQAVFRYLFRLPINALIERLERAFEHAETDELLFFTKESDSLFRLINCYLLAVSQKDKYPSLEALLKKNECLKTRCRSRLFFNAVVKIPYSWYNLFLGEKLPEKEKQIITQHKLELLRIIDQVNNLYEKALYLDIASDPLTPVGECIAKDRRSLKHSVETAGQRGSICGQARVLRERILQDFWSRCNKKTYSAMVALISISENKDFDNATDSTRGSSLSS